MSIMPSSVQIGLILGSFIGLFIAFLRLPHWLMRSVQRHRLWRLRDRIMMDTVTGRLPRQDPAVRTLRRQTERMIDLTYQHTIVSFWVWSFVWRRCDPAVRDQLHEEMRADHATDGLTPEQAERVNRYGTHLTMISGQSILFGTWLGFLCLLWLGIPALVMRHLRERRSAVRRSAESELRATFAEAAAKASRETWIGRRSLEFVETESDGGGLNSDRHLAGVA